MKIMLLMINRKLIFITNNVGIICVTYIMVLVLPHEKFLHVCLNILKFKPHSSIQSRVSDAELKGNPYK